MLSCVSCWKCDCCFHAWINKVFTTTMGSATDLQDEGLRRLLVNAAYRMTGLKVPKKAEVALVGEYHPTAYGFNGYVRGVKPAAHELK